MDSSKKGDLTGQVRRFRVRFVQSAGSALGQVITEQVKGRSKGPGTDKFFKTTTRRTISADATMGIP